MSDTKVKNKQRQETKRLMRQLKELVLADIEEGHFVTIQVERELRAVPPGDIVLYIRTKEKE